MERFSIQKNLPLLTLLLGGFGLAMRLWLNTTANDKGFITRGHISLTLLLVVTVIALVLLFAVTRSLRQASKYKFNFPPSLVGGVGAVLAAIGFGVTSVMELLVGGHTLNVVTAWIGVLAMAALLFVAHSRWKGLHPSMLFHSVICAYLMLRLICMYRQWSSNPQMTDYCFELLALVCAMLSAYHRATFDANFGRRSSYTFFSLAGVYFCCLSLGGANGPVLFFALGAWLFTDQCNLTPMPGKNWGKEG